MLLITVNVVIKQRETLSIYGLK